MFLNEHFVGNTFHTSASSFVFPQLYSFMY